MSNITEFPNSSDNYYRKGLAYIKNLDIDQALACFEQSYHIDSNLNSFIEIIQILLSNHLESKLKEYWQDYLTPFESNKLLGSKKILDSWLQSLPVIYSRSETFTHLSNLIIDNSDPNIHLKLQSEIQTIKQDIQTVQHILELSDAKNHIEYIQKVHKTSPYNLLQIIKLLFDEFNEDYLPFLLHILSEPEIENYIKSDILHFFVYQQIDLEVTLSWFKQTYSIQTKKLLPYHQSKMYLSNYKAIETHFSKNDPHFLQSAIEQFTLHCMVFYPFIDDILENDNEWLNAFLHLYFDDHIMSSDSKNSLVLYLHKANSDLQFILQ